MRWGVRDTTTAPKVTWIGNDSGPILFDESEFDTPEIARGVARIAAQTLEMQAYGSDLGGKYVAQEFPETSVKKVDSIPTKMGSLKALKRVEGDFS